MEHTNEMLQILDNIIACGENMAKLGTLLKKSLSESRAAAPQETPDRQGADAESTAKEPMGRKTEMPAAPTYTFADVRNACSAKSHAGYTNQVKELIGKYGADRLSDVKEADLPALMADLEAIG